jgi:long-chain acyl-CoA synthetase
LAGKTGNLGYFFADSVARFPEKTAVIDLHGGVERQVTYAQLDERADRVASLVRRLGAAPGERVGMIVGNRVEFLEIFFGAMRAGAIPVPINTRLARDTLKFILEDAECKVVFVEPAIPHGMEVSTSVPTCVSLDDYEKQRDASERLKAPPELPPDAQAFQPYTSGSTGVPKGAIMTHAGMLWYVKYNQKHWPATPDDRGMIALPLFHKNAMRGSVKPMLYAGGSFVLMPAYEPRSYLQALSKYRCTYSRGVAAVFTMFLQHRDQLSELDLSNLKQFTIGSAVVTHELMDEVERAIPGIKVNESYGLTEGGSPFREPIDGRPVPRGSPGAQAPEFDVRLVGPDGTDQAEEGELWLRSPYNCRGYHKRPDVTAAKLVDGWLRTGDVFRRDSQGFYYFKTRVDDMFSCGGENIYPKEVEDLLFRHPAVANAVVAPVPHAVKGYVPAAMVVLKKGVAATADEIKTFCLNEGPKYAHPRFVEIIGEQEMPLNGAGKIDRAVARVRLTERTANRASPAG